MMTIFRWKSRYLNELREPMVECKEPYYITLHYEKETRALEIAIKKPLHEAIKEFPPSVFETPTFQGVNFQMSYDEIESEWV